ncbi:hypothetical protein Tco_0308831 [Tanacetum coccineum]
MDDPNITMEEYIRIEEEKARRHAIVFDDTFTFQATLSCEPTVSPLNDNEIDFRISFDESDDEDYMPTVSYFDDLDYLKDFENEFPAIVYNDALTSKSDFLTEPTVIYPDDLKSNKGNDDKPWGFVSVIPLLDEINTDVGAYAQGSNKLLKTSHDMALPPRCQRHQYLRFEVLGYTDANIKDFEERLSRIYSREIHRAKSARQIPDKGDLSTYWVGISSTRDFLGTTLYYTLIRDSMPRLCHRLITYNIAGRSQVPEKVTVIDLFYLRGMDVGLVNIPYLLARYLRMFASGRKRNAMIYGRQFVAHLTEHFGLLIEERLQGLTMIVRHLPMIDMDELVRIHICEELDDTWAWVASRPERQQAPQPPLAAGPARTMVQRINRLDEDVHGMRGALGKQREVLDSIAYDFSRFTTWTVIGVSQMMDQAGVKYTSYADF